MLSTEQGSGTNEGVALYSIGRWKRYERSLCYDAGELPFERGSDAAWRAGILHEQVVVDARAYVSSDGRSSSSVRELVPLL